MLSCAAANGPKLLAQMVYVPPLDKTPLVFWHETYRLKRSTRKSSFLPLSDQAAILCHFKFRPGREEHALKELESDDRQSPVLIQAVLNAARKESLLSSLTDAIRIERIDDLANSGWLSGDANSFQEFWRANNKSRHEWFRFQASTCHLSGNLAAIDLQASMLALMSSPSWCISKSLRLFLVRRGWLSFKHAPKVWLDPAGPAGVIKFIVGSLWWDLALPVRLIFRLRRKRR